MCVMCTNGTIKLEVALFMLDLFSILYTSNRMENLVKYFVVLTPIALAVVGNMPYTADLLVLLKCVKYFS